MIFPLSFDFIILLHFQNIFCVLVDIKWTWLNTIQCYNYLRPNISTIISVYICAVHGTLLNLRMTFIDPKQCSDVLFSWKRRTWNGKHSKTSHVDPNDMNICEYIAIVLVHESNIQWKLTLPSKRMHPGNQGWDDGWQLKIREYSLVMSSTLLPPLYLVLSSAVSTCEIISFSIYLSMYTIMPMPAAVFGDLI